MVPVIGKLLWVVSCLHNIILPFLFILHLLTKNSSFPPYFYCLFNSQRVTLDNVHTLFHAMKIVFLVLLLFCCLPFCFSFHFILLLCEESHNAFGSPIILSISYYSFEYAGGIAQQGMECYFAKFVEISIILVRRLRRIL